MKAKKAVDEKRGRTREERPVVPDIAYTQREKVESIALAAGIGREGGSTPPSLACDIYVAKNERVREMMMDSTTGSVA